MSTTLKPSPLAAPAKPERITVDTLPQLFAHHRARFGGWTMTLPTPEPSDQPPPRPEDVTEADWDALGDPGKRLIVREREARAKAERDLAAARARPGPPKPAPAPAPTPAPAPAPAPGPAPSPTDQPDIATIVKQAVEAAFKPFADRETVRETEAAAGKVRDVVLEAAKPLLHDATDALANVDLASVVNDQGIADPAKVKTALEAVVQTKPHLAKTATRVAPIGIGGGASTGAVSEGDRVKALLADMQRSAGVRTATATS